MPKIVNTPKKRIKPNAFSKSVGEGLRRAAAIARETARIHGTPIIGIKNGKLVAEKP